jgi:hypothetical protein
MTEFSVPADVRGCTDKTAVNFDGGAAACDSSCVYECDQVVGNDVTEEETPCYIYDRVVGWIEGTSGQELSWADADAARLVVQGQCASESGSKSPDPGEGPVMAQAIESVVSWGPILGGDPGEGLDFDGDFLYAVDFGGVQFENGISGRVYPYFVGDAGFTVVDLTDGLTYDMPGLAKEAWLPIGATGSSRDDWALQQIVQGYRSSFVGKPCTFDLAGLTVGNPYRLQLMFAEKKKIRSLDVTVGGELIVSNWAPYLVQDHKYTQGSRHTPQLGDEFIWDTSTVGAWISYEFSAAADVLAVHLVATNGGQVIIQAVSLEMLLATPSIKYDKMPQFNARPELHKQSLSLRHVRVEAHTAFGGGGTDHGAAMSLSESTCALESVEYIGNTQKGIGAGVIFAVGSNITASFAMFKESRNLGQGAGVIAASAGSRVAFSHAQFLGNVADNQMGLLGQKISAIGHWPLDGHGRDVSGSGLDGTPINVDWVIGKRAGAAYFSGDDAVIVQDIGDTVLDVENVLMVAWIKPSDRNVGIGGTLAVDRGIVMNKDLVYEFGLQDITGQLQGAFGPGCWRWWGNEVIALDEWTHVAVGVDGTSERYFVNGAFGEQDGCAGKLTVNDNDFRIGARSLLGNFADLADLSDSSFGSQFKGTIDEAMLFGRCLSDREVHALYRAVYDIGDGAASSTSRASEQSASCIASDLSAVSATHSSFLKNEGGDVIFARRASTVDLVHSTFKHNIAKTAAKQLHLSYGGATISLWEASVATLEEVSFIENTGVTAGAILVTEESKVTINEGILSGNTASATDAAGAAIFANQRAQFYSSQNTFDGNSASAHLSAGVIHASGGSEITLTDARLSNNQAVGNLIGAGAVYADNSRVSLIRANISWNTATGGTALTSSNYADALYVRSPLKIFVQDTSFNPLVWGGKTVSIVPRIVNPGAQVVD